MFTYLAAHTIHNNDCCCCTRYLWNSERPSIGLNVLRCDRECNHKLPQRQSHTILWQKKSVGWKQKRKLVEMYGAVRRESTVSCISSCCTDIDNMLIWICIEENKIVTFDFIRAMQFMYGLSSMTWTSIQMKKKTQNWNRNASQFILSYELVNIFQSLKKKSRRWTLHKSGLSLFYLFFTNNANMIHSYRKTRSNNLITFNDQAMIRWGKL